MRMVSVPPEPVSWTLRRLGLTRQQVCEMLTGKPATTSHYVCKPGNERRAYSEADYARIRELLAKGWNQNRIAKELGIPRGTMTHVLSRLTKEDTKK